MINKKIIKADRNNSHLAGEYFVAAELYKRGYQVGMTLGNAKAIDMFIQKGKSILPIQVKSIFNKKNVGWPFPKDKNKLENSILYIFINLNGNLEEHPKYYIAFPEEAKKEHKEYSTRGIINISKLENAKFLNRWDKIDQFYKKRKLKLNN